MRLIPGTMVLMMAAMMLLAASACDGGATKATPTSPGSEGAGKAASGDAAAAKGAAGDAKPGAGAAAAAPAGGQDDSYSMASPDVSLTVGAEGKAAITVKAAPGFKVNQEYPWKAQITAGEKLTVTQLELKKDAWTLTEKEASVGIPVVAKEAGDDKLEAKLKFSICNDQQCFMLNKTATIKVAAK